MGWYTPQMWFFSTYNWYFCSRKRSGKAQVKTILDRMGFYEYRIGSIFWGYIFVGGKWVPPLF